MKTTNERICPNCGKTITTPLTLITATQIKKLSLRDDIPVDEVLYDFIESYGGVMPQENLLKQVVYEESHIPDEIKKYIKNNKLLLQIGTDEIDQKACPFCHSNVTPLYRKDISNIINVLLIGLPGASKTTLVASLFKLMTDDAFINKKERIVHGASPKSFEYDYYKKISEKYPVIEDPTNHDDGHFNRQPLFYCIVDETMLIFHDYPGESLKDSTFSIPDNSIPVYLFDSTIKSDEQLAFFTTKIIELHDSGANYKKEHMTFVKCDIMDFDFVNSIMLKPYKTSEFDSFAGLLAARRRILHDSDFNHPVYYKLKNYSSSVDVSCLAALGCNTHQEGSYFVLDGPWSPKFLYDFLLTIGG